MRGVRPGSGAAPRQRALEGLRHTVAAHPRRLPTREPLLRVPRLRRTSRAVAPARDRGQSPWRVRSSRSARARLVEPAGDDEGSPQPNDRARAARRLERSRI